MGELRVEHTGLGAYRAMWVAVIFSVAGCHSQEQEVRPFIAAGEDGSLESDVSGADGGLAGDASADPSGDQDASGLSSEGGECPVKVVPAALAAAPVDVVMLVDNSLAMVDALRALESNINDSFAGVLEAEEVDYRVILISQQRRSLLSLNTVCVEGPLSGLAECPAAEPAFTERFFQYSTVVGGGESLEVLLGTYAAPVEDGLVDEFDNAANGWSEWLRPGAQTVFVAFTESDSDLESQAFLADLTGLDPQRFGADAGNPAFVWHSFSALAAKDTAATPYVATEPVEESTCGSLTNIVFTPGGVYQELARKTGGLRFPVCATDSLGEMFEQLADTLVAGAGLSCSFPLPAVSGEAEPTAEAELEAALAVEAELDLAATTLGVVLDGEATETWTQVLSEAECQADAFYIDGEKVVLCEESCLAVRAAEAPSVEVNYQTVCEAGR